MKSVLFIWCVFLTSRHRQITMTPILTVVEFSQGTQNWLFSSETILISISSKSYDQNLPITRNQMCPQNQILCPVVKICACDLSHFNSAHKQYDGFLILPQHNSSLKFVSNTVLKLTTELKTMIHPFGKLRQH